MSDVLRILIADDHKIVREGLRLILESDPGMEVVAEAEDGEAAVARACELEPDIVLMDVRMPRLEGIEAVRRLRALRPEVEVVILTMYDRDDLLIAGLRAGARGYLLKDTDRETLLNTIRAAARGEVLMRPEAIDKLVAGATRSASHTDETAASGKAEQKPVLTGRELQVLEAVTRGEKSRQIAARLEITERTVKAHLASIYAKLDVDSRAAAAAAAIRRGLVRGEL